MQLHIALRIQGEATVAAGVSKPAQYNVDIKRSNDESQAGSESGRAECSRFESGMKPFFARSGGPYRVALLGHSACDSLGSMLFKAATPTSHRCVEPGRPSQAEEDCVLFYIASAVGSVVGTDLQAGGYR